MIFSACFPEDDKRGALLAFLEANAGACFIYLVRVLKLADLIADLFIYSRNLLSININS